MLFSIDKNKKKKKRYGSVVELFGFFYSVFPKLWWESVRIKDRSACQDGFQKVNRQFAHQNLTNK